MSEQVNMRDTTATAAAGPVERVRPRHDDIACRAYEFFLARGAVHGSHEQDWLQAERELRFQEQMTGTSP